MKNTKLISFLFLLTLGFSSFAQEEKLTRPADIGNANMDQVVAKSYDIYDSTIMIKERDVAAIKKQVDELELNIATITNAGEKKSEIEASINKVIAKSEELNSKAEELVNEVPTKVEEAVGAVKPGVKSVKEIKAIKDHGAAGVKALKASIAQTPEIVKTLKDMSAKLASLVK